MSLGALTALVIVETIVVCLLAVIVVSLPDAADTTTWSPPRVVPAMSRASDARRFGVGSDDGIAGADPIGTAAPWA